MWPSFILCNMSRFLAIAVAVLSAILFTTAFLKSAKPASADEPTVAGRNTAPIVVELFTSEGCSSCPPADKLLGELDKQAAYAGVPVVALGEHVDYWDGLGWKDRFSSPAFTARQREFGNQFALDSVYTPQMVVDGKLELVGNDENALRRALVKAANSAKSVTVDLGWESPGKLRVTATDTAKHKARVLIAITESELTTSVQRGENGGRVLHHAAVVRQLAQLGQMSESRFSTVATVAVNPEWKLPNLKAVVLVQDDSTKSIVGARAIQFPKL